MSLSGVKQFFKNTVTIQLKDGHKFEGLLKRVDYGKQEIELQDVEDLGNSNDNTSIPHHKKIQSKIFQQQSIIQIFFKEKHFCEPKKYNQLDFWDPVSQDKPKQKIHYEQKKPYRGDNNNNRNRRQYNNNNRGQYRQKQPRVYQKKQEYNEGQYR